MSPACNSNRGARPSSFVVNASMEGWNEGDGERDVDRAAADNANARMNGPWQRRLSVLRGSVMGRPRRRLWIKNAAQSETETFIHPVEREETP